MIPKLSRRLVALVATTALFAVMLVSGVAAPPSGAATVDPCGAGGNAVACENTKAGSPEATWDTPNPSSTIEGYATDTSVNVGSSINFKIKTPSTAYRLDIYRIGYYGGNGARLITSINPSASLPQTQPACITQTATGLVDCGNWAVSASWAVPSTAVSGVYEAKLVRTDSPGLNNQIMFVVRNDASHSDLVFQTSDTTWQAYNTWGGNSLYSGGAAGRAYKVSYNRPYSTRSLASGEDFFFNTEYPTVRFLEAQGYDISYMSGLDTDRRGALLLNHKTFLSVGHDEYWSGAQRANVEAARDAGVNLAFLSGNIALWKTRYETSIDGSGTAYRTLVTYKETKDDAKTDPTSTWTGTWRDPRFSPPADGGRPENAMTGTLWLVQGTDQQMKVPAEAGALRLWRNTSMASLPAGGTGVLPRGVLGYEYDVDVDNGFRPAGLFDLSSTTNNENEVAYHFGALVAPNQATHSLTMYRAPSGALVFSAATVQWAYGLDANHDDDNIGTTVGTGNPPVSPDMQQATVNLLADMGAQPVTLYSTLTAATKSTDTTPPSSTITSPTSGATFTNGTLATVSGTASDVGGRVAGVEVSLDGGATWHEATGRGTWTYTGTFTGNSATSVRVRATDDSGNIQTTPSQVGVSVTCPCSMFGLNQTPTVTSDTDTNAVSLGTRFQSDINGYVTGVRFYKGAGNTGTHTGSLWNTAGQRLATATFSGESASGWQQANFSSPVAITAGTTYVVSYYAPSGHYADDLGYFSQTGSTTGPVRALSNAAAGGNGTFAYGGDLYPSSAFGATNYWVDAIVSTTTVSTGPQVLSQTPASGAVNVPVSTTITATFDQAVQPASATVAVSGPGNVAVAGTTSYNSTTKTVTFTPSAALAGNTPYSVSVTATDLTGHAMANPATWSFTTVAVAGTCPCNLFPSSAVPTTPSVNDPSSVEVGVRFSADRSGQISGVRFYKGSSNVGTHIGSLWTSTGTLLARATFSSESASGWQQVNFTSPVSITAGTSYVASYHTSGFYSATQGQFTSAGVDNAPLHAPADSASAHNGVYAYGSTPAFPSSSYAATNYSVDVVFVDGTDTTKPTVTSTVPASGATGVATSTTVKAVMSERLQAGTASIALSGPSGSVAGSTAYDDPTTSVTFTPSAVLAGGSTYTATLSGAKDLAGNLIAAPVSWSFTTAVAPSSFSLFTASDLPAVASSGDTGNVELGVRFTPDVNGTITGVRFYKGSANTGTHTGTLWSSAGAQLATGTFSGETATGWQTLTFTTPVSVTAGQVYTASYHAPVGNYAYTSAYFNSQLDRAPLHAPASSNGGNGVYVYGNRAFPSSTYNATNYWVDAVFVPAPSGAAVTALAAPVANSTLGLSALVADVPKVNRFTGPFFLSSSAP